MKENKENNNAKDGDADDQDDVPREEQLRVANLSTWVEETRKLDENTQHRKDIKSHREYVSGKIDGKQVRANLLYSTMAGSLPLIYAKNPEISVTPSEAVSASDYKLTKKFARTLQIVTQKSLESAKLKKRAKSCVRSAQVTKIGWLKLVYQRDIETDPLIASRIQDSQDNLQRIERLICDCDDDAEKDENIVKRAELKEQIAALEKSVEVTVAEGLVLDRILTEDMVIDSEITDFDCYTDAKRMGHRIWFTYDSFKETFGREPEGTAHKYKTKAGDNNDTTISDEKALYCVWEIWEKVSNTILTFCAGEKRWARAPYQPEKLGEQWYPFFPLCFNILDGRFLGLSDVEMLQELQKEYNQIRDDYAEVRSKNKPHLIISSDADEKSIKRQTNAEIGEIIIVDTQGQPLNDTVKEGTTMRIDAAQYDVGPIRADMEFVHGMGDSASGSVRKAKTATEAEILQGALSSRTGERSDTTEDWIGDMAKYAAEILLQELSEQQVQRMAGSEAVWPSMTKDEVFDQVNIEIRAGTAGKPNKIQEQKQWLEFMPVLRESMVQIAELRAQGQAPLADAMVKILKETLRRFDDRIDVEEFLPQQEQESDDVDGQGVPGQEGAQAGQPSQEDQMMQMQQMKQEMQQQMEEFGKQMELLDAQIRKTNSEADKNAAVALKTVGSEQMPTQQY